MVDIPDVEPPPEAVRDNIMQWYQTHKETYHKVWGRLDTLRDRWSLLGKREKIALLKTSYMFSVLSVRTPVHIHEEAFTRIINGESIAPAMKAAGAGMVDGQDWFRAPKMKETLADDSLWDEAVDLLDAGKIDTAHELLQAQGGWLGAAKAPFTLANLGFVQKMCINGNVARLLRTDPPESRTKAEDYEELCADVRALFPDLADILRPYELQWLLFDYQRFFRSGGDQQQGGPAPERTRSGMAVAKHDAWFEVALGDISRLTARIEALTREAKGQEPDQDFGGGDFDPTDPDVPVDVSEEDLRRNIDQEIEEAIEASITDEQTRERVKAEVDDALEDALNG